MYWDYAEEHGLDAAQHVVIAYFDPETVVELLLEDIDVESLEDYLCENLAEEDSFQPVEQSEGDFLRELEELREFPSDRVNWLQEGL